MAAPCIHLCHVRVAVRFTQFCSCSPPSESLQVPVLGCWNDSLAGMGRTNSKLVGVLFSGSLLEKVWATTHVQCHDSLIVWMMSLYTWALEVVIPCRSGRQGD